ncbi:type-1B angiotensin II receptor-like [Micropterus dolomieu]|uniref:type-1B angiotensin II receptor-like n=1 Tax=Micropterus dolomieu TaxID=147949 RepID=UPI001E8E94ED|nr:type-1B angiotensin II receptor-like [Micropterus dolomieu]
MLGLECILVQRYLQVVYLQKCLHQVGRKRLLALLWLVSMILSIPALVVRQVIEDQDWTHCKSDYLSQTRNVAVLLIQSLLGFVSFSVVAFSYIRLHRKVNQAAFFSNPQTTRLVTSIIVTFFVLLMPHLVMNVLGMAAFSLNNKGLLTFCINNWNITGALVFVNSCLNPLFYAFALLNNNNVNAEVERSRKSNH